MKMINHQAISVMECNSLLNKSPGGRSLLITRKRNKDTMKKFLIVSFLIIITSTVILQDITFAAGGILKTPLQAPEFTHSSKQEWINSTPLHISDLEGKVVLIDFWTFGCWNCYRSFPWLNAMEKRLNQENFQVIGVHTPEFENEKIKENIVVKVQEFGLHHPIMIDNNS